MKRCVRRMWILMNCAAKWIFTTPDKITTQDSPLSIPYSRGKLARRGGGKKSNGQNEEINQSETVLIMETGSTSLAESSSH